MSKSVEWKNGKPVRVNYDRVEKDGCVSRTSYKAGSSPFGGVSAVGKPTRTTSKPK